jgi:hypothetical protein
MSSAGSILAAPPVCGQNYTAISYYAIQPGPSRNQSAFSLRSPRMNRPQARLRLRYRFRPLSVIHAKALPERILLR